MSPYCSSVCVIHWIIQVHFCTHVAVPIIANTDVCSVKNTIRRFVLFIISFSLFLSASVILADISEEGG